MFVLEEFRQKMDGIYGVLSKHKFENVFIETLRAKEKNVIDYLTRNNINISLNDILPVIPFANTIRKQIQIIETNIPEIIEATIKLCKDPILNCPKKADIGFLSRMGNIDFDWFYDIARVPQKAYFVVDFELRFAKAEAFDIRNEKGRGRQTSGSFFTMYEAFSYCMFADNHFPKIFREEDVENFFVLNSTFLEKDKYRIILKIFDTENGPKIMITKEFFHSVDTDHYIANNFTYVAKKRI